MFGLSVSSAREHLMRNHFDENLLDASLLDENLFNERHLNWLCKALEKLLIRATNRGSIAKIMTLNNLRKKTYPRSSGIVSGEISLA